MSANSIPRDLVVFIEVGGIGFLRSMKRPRIYAGLDKWFSKLARVSNKIASSYKDMTCNRPGVESIWGVHRQIAGKGQLLCSESEFRKFVLNHLGDPSQPDSSI